MPLAPHQQVVLTGFMGAGKSTVGRLLAPLLGWQFIDADEALSEQANTSIAALFSLHGESHFRALEASLLSDLLHKPETVLALGGGALEHAATRALLAASTSTLVVYLETSLDVALHRCARQDGGALRPVLQDPATVAMRFRSRLPVYRTAHLVVPAGDAAPEQIASRIVQAVRSREK